MLARIAWVSTIVVIAIAEIPPLHADGETRNIAFGFSSMEYGKGFSRHAHTRDADGSCVGILAHLDLTAAKFGFGLASGATVVVCEAKGTSRVLAEQPVGIDAVGEVLGINCRPRQYPALLEEDVSQTARVCSALHRKDHEVGLLIVW